MFFAIQIQSITMDRNDERSQVAIENKGFAFTPALGCILEDDRMYSGSFREEGVDNFQVFIRPNLEF